AKIRSRPRSTSSGESLASLPRLRLPSVEDPPSPEFRMPDSTLPRPRILAIHSHPDDIEFQCAGTLALLAEAGCHLTLATMTPGDCGSIDRDAETIAAVRRAEAQASADLIGADYVCLEFRD